ncbi:MAG: hypothetical protein ICV70_06720 [Jiangellaceae bacterium]|nr:hypothetical protein [Jiangellaceae bacterium]
MSTPPSDRPGEPVEGTPPEPMTPPGQPSDPYGQQTPAQPAYGQPADRPDEQRGDQRGEQRGEQPEPGYPPGSPPAPSWPAGTPRARPTPPPSILTAVRLMYAGAALGAVIFVLTLVTQGSIREELERSSPELTPDQIDTAVSISIGIAVLFGLVGVLLWVWMAESNRRGKSWARIVATVLGGLNIVTTLFSLFTAQNMSLTTVFSVLSAALAAIIIYFLYRPDSTAYYQAVSG